MNAGGRGGTYKWLALALFLAVAVAVTTGAACGGDDPRSKIVGWPPAEGVFASAMPMGDAVDNSVSSASDSVESVVGPFPLNPCRNLVELACSYFGDHTDDCQEARADVPDATDAATVAACEAMLVRYQQVEEPKRMNPCRRYSRAVCKALGKESADCVLARQNTATLRRAEQKRACLGDLLMWEARALPRP